MTRTWTRWVAVLPAAALAAVVGPAVPGAAQQAPPPPRTAAVAEPTPSPTPTTAADAPQTGTEVPNEGGPPRMQVGDAPLRYPASDLALAAAAPVVVNDNAGWCWFQDQRAIFTRDDRLLVGSVATAEGTGGVGRSGGVEVATRDLRTGRNLSVDRLLTGLRPDDHNAPALLELPSGRLVAAWSGHDQQTLLHNATLDPTDLAWTPGTPNDRKATLTTRNVSYSNLLRLGAENGGRGRIYDFYRGEGFGPNALVSDDDGRTWRTGGTLLTSPGQRPYVRYASNGVDRIDFIASTGNPTEVIGNSVRSGYLQAGKVYTSTGVQVGTLAAGDTRWDELTPVLAGVPAAREGADTDIWTADLELGPGGPVAVLTSRLPGPSQAGQGVTDNRYHHARWNGTSWDVHEIAFGGSELYATQPAYTGNVAVDPTNVDRVFISANVDPATGVARRSGADGRSHWEIYEGTTADAGATWSWSAVTANSGQDNIRPTVASGNGRWGLLWMRGSYPHYERYDTDIVAVLDGAGAGAARAEATQVPGRTTLAAGRFTSKAADGLFRVGSGPTDDGFLLPGSPQWRYVNKSLAGDYRPYVADTDGNGRDEVLLVRPTGGTAQKLSLEPDSSVRNRPFTAPAGAVPLVGDFNGDRRDDVLWYRAGTAADELWTSGSGGTPRKSAIAVNGTYRPVVADVDGNGYDDILWHAPGPTPDPIWRHGRSGRIGGVLHVSGSYRPVAGDFDGNGRDDVFWQAADPAKADSVWSWRSTGTLQYATRTVDAPAAPAVAGDVDGDGRADLFFDAEGAGRDTWWYRGRAPA